jgi:hypothetical protein
MTDTAIAQSPAPDASATPTPAPAPIPPTAAPPVAEQVQDDEGLDLLADDGDEAGADVDGSEGEDGSETIKAIGPGDDASAEEITAWRAEHGVPDAPDGYSAPTIEGIEWNADSLGPIHEIANRHNVPQQAVADALAEYGKQIQTQQAAIRQRDAEAAKAVRSELTEAEIVSVKTAARAMPVELRQMLNTAVLPDGTRLVNQPEVLRLIAAGYGTKGGNPPPLRDNRTMLREELNEIDALMNRDIGEYHRPWRATGVSASDRRMQIMRELGNESPAKPSAVDVRTEVRKLEQLRGSDPQMFQFGSWPGARSPAERLAAIQQGRD